jgi:hypothetical protein
MCGDSGRICRLGGEVRNTGEPLENDGERWRGERSLTYPADERGEPLEVVVRQVRSDELDLVRRYRMVHLADEVLLVQTQSHL